MATIYEQQSDPLYVLLDRARADDGATVALGFQRRITDRMAFRFDAVLEQYMSPIRETPVLDIAIIPHTFENTNLKRAAAGDTVNLEFDIIAKYVERMLNREKS